MTSLSSTAHVFRTAFTADGAMNLNPADTIRQSSIRRDCVRTVMESMNKARYHRRLSKREAAVVSFMAVYIFNNPSFPLKFSQISSSAFCNLFKLLRHYFDSLLNLRFIHVAYVQADTV